MNDLSSKLEFIIKTIKKCSKIYCFLFIDGLEVGDVKGMFYLPIFNKWCWITDTSVNFALSALKPEIPEMVPEKQTNETETQ